MSINGSTHIVIRQLGIQPYVPVWQQMKAFTDARDEHTQDEIWLLQHEPVFTLGQAGKTRHLLTPGDISVIQSDRGGQVTYHGPGQLIVYLLINLRHRGLGVKQLVIEIQQALINTLAEFGIESRCRDKAPGVYVGERKIASLGLRVRKNCTYHGLSLNMAMDLSPFSQINVCGYEGLEVTQICDLAPTVNESELAELLCAHLINRLGYTTHEARQGWSNIANGEN